MHWIITDRTKRFFAITITLSLIAVALVLVFTRFGPGASGDSVYYVMGAENIARGMGFSRISGGGEIRPIAGFPPLFPIVLSLFYSPGSDLFASARYLNAALLGLNVILATWLIYRYSASIVAASIGGFVLITTDTMVELHGWVMSEPLFISLTLAALLAFSIYIQRGNKLLFVLAALLAGLSIMVRYAGIAILPVMLIALLVFRPGRLKMKLFLSFGLTLIVIGPLLFSLLRNFSEAGAGVGREIVFHMMRPELAWLYLTELSSWFAPNHLPLDENVRALIAMVIAFGIPVYFIWREYLRLKSGDPTPREGRSEIPWMSLLYILAYIAVLIVNSLLFDAATTSTAPPRYLLPVFVITVILFVSLVARIVQNFDRGKTMRFAVLAYAAVVIGFGIPQVSEILIDPMPYIGYSGFARGNPEVVQQLNDLDEKVIISNNPELVFFLTDRPAYMRPIDFDPYSLDNREDYQQQLKFAQNLLDSGEAVFVQLREPRPEEENVIEDLDLQIIESYDEATFYTSPATIGTSTLHRLAVKCSSSIYAMELPRR